MFSCSPNQFASRESGLIPEYVLWKPHRYSGYDFGSTQDEYGSESQRAYLDFLNPACLNL